MQIHKRGFAVLPIRMVGGMDEPPVSECAHNNMAKHFFRYSNVIMCYSICLNQCFLNYSRHTKQHHRLPKPLSFPPGVYYRLSLALEEPRSALILALALWVLVLELARPGAGLIGSRNLGSHQVTGSRDIKHGWQD